MGANFQAGTIKAETYNEAVAIMAEEIEQDRQVQGSDYTGSIGMASGVHVVGRTFESQLEADEWLMNNAHKWGPMIGVKIPDGWRFGLWCAE